MTEPNQPVPQRTPPPNSTLALVGFTMAVAAVVGAFLPVLGAMITVPLTLAGLVTSIVADVQIKRANGQLGGRGFAIAGIWISAVWLGLCVLIVAAMAVVLIFAGFVVPWI